MSHSLKVFNPLTQRYLHLGNENIPEVFVLVVGLSLIYLLRGAE